MHIDTGRPNGWRRRALISRALNGAILTPDDLDHFAALLPRRKLKNLCARIAGCGRGWRLCRCNDGAYYPLDHE